VNGINGSNLRLQFPVSSVAACSFSLPPSLPLAKMANFLKIWSNYSYWKSPNSHNFSPLKFKYIFLAIDISFSLLSSSPSLPFPRKTKPLVVCCAFATQRASSLALSEALSLLTMLAAVLPSIGWPLFVFVLVSVMWNLAAFCRFSSNWVLIVAMQRRKPREEQRETSWKFLWFLFFWRLICALRNFFGATTLVVHAAVCICLSVCLCEMFCLLDRRRSSKKVQEERLVRVFTWALCEICTSGKSEGACWSGRSK